VAGSFECDNEPPGTIKCVELLDWLVDWLVSFVS
jgi:hypothetical protein